MDLLERGSHIDRLRTCLAAAVAGQGGVVCLAGEAGVGKTALARAFAAQAGIRVLWGACEDLATPEALGPLRDWTRDAGWRLPDQTGENGGRLAIFSDTLAALGCEASLAVIEDLHWADDATLDLVRFLGRRIADRPVLLLVTARDDTEDARRRIRHALSAIPVPFRSNLSVPRLSAEAVQGMAREAGRDGASLYAVTGGNAFFVTELLKGDDTLSPTVRDAVMARFDSLPEGARSVVGAASIFPRRVEGWLLERLCPDITRSLDDAVTAGVIGAETDSYAFRHEIARRAIEEAMPAPRRAALHRAALAALVAVPGVALARLVHHADAAGDASAIRSLAPRAGAEASRVGAHREAARHYVTALKHSITFDALDRASLYAKCAFELHLVGQMREAIAAQLAAVEIHRLRGDRVAEGDGLRWLSRLHYLNGDRAEADRYAGEALSVLEGQEAPAELAMAFSNLGQLAMLRDDAPAALAWGERAIALATKLGRPDILSHALNNTGAARRWVDRDAARAGLAESLAIALANDLPEHAARAYTNAAYAAIGWRDDAAAEALLDAGRAYCETRDLETWRDYMQGCRAELLLRHGRWEEAATAALAVLAVEGATPLVRFPAVAALARIRLRRGDPDAASLLDEMESFMTTCSEAPRFLSYAVVRAEQAWLTEQAGPALPDLLREAVRVAVRTGDCWTAGEIGYWAGRLGIAGLDTGLSAAPYRQLGEGAWAEAASAWRSIGAPYEEALALLSGDGAARRDGLAMLDALGARAAAERFRRELRASGVRHVPRGPHPATRANAAGLTRRQMQVLRLIDQGLSNARIGGQLFVSPKTIDHHVSAILAKLDARTRGEAAALARAAGLIGE